MDEEAARAYASHSMSKEKLTAEASCGAAAIADRNHRPANEGRSPRVCGKMGYTSRGTVVQGKHFHQMIMRQQRASVHNDTEQVEHGPALRVESLGKVPAMEFRRLATGEILFRYAIDDSSSAHLGFDEVWREMSAYDRRQTLLMGGRVAEWLQSLGDGESK